MDHSISALKGVAIPLDISKFVQSTTTNGNSTTPEGNSQEWKEFSLKHSTVISLNDSYGVSSEFIIDQEELQLRTTESKIEFRADTGEMTAVSNPETRKLQFETGDHCNLPSVENSKVLDFTEEVDESLDDDQDVSWFFGSQSCSESPTSVLVETVLPGVFPSMPTGKNSVFPTLKQGKKETVRVDECRKTELDKLTNKETKDTSFQTTFCTLDKSSRVCGSLNANSGEKCASCFNILQRYEDSVPGSTSLSHEKSVTEQFNWQKVDSVSNIFGSPKQDFDTAEQTLQAQKGEFSNRLAALLQHKQGKFKRDITSLSKYSRMVSFHEHSLSAQIASLCESSPIPVDFEQKGACESVDSSSDDEFSTCFDNVPTTVDTASNVASVFLSKTFRKQATRKQNLSASGTNAEMLENLSHKSKVSTVEKRFTNLLQLQQKEDMSISDIKSLSKYSRVLSGCSTSLSKTEASSVFLNRSQRDFDKSNIPSSADRKCAVIHPQVLPYDDIATNLNILGKRLSHGKKREMDLAVQVVQEQVNYARETLSTGIQIETKLIHVETVLGPPSLESQIIDGLVIEVDDIEANLLKKVAGKPLSIVLVNGDITPEFRYLGLGETTPLKQVLRCEDGLKILKNDCQLWFEQIKKKLSALNISVVVAKGVVDDMVADHCRAVGIVVLQKVMFSKLQLLSVCCGVTITTYLTDIRTSEVSGPITVDFFESGWTSFTYRNPSTKSVSTTARRTSFVVLRNAFDYQHEKENLVAPRCAPLQTVLISGPSRDIVCDTEMKFWSCFHSLKNTLSCKRVLPGAGDSERACIHELERLQQQGKLVVLQKIFKCSLWMYVTIFGVGCIVVFGALPFILQLSES